VNRSPVVSGIVVVGLLAASGLAALAGGTALAQAPSASQPTLVNASPSSATPQVVDGQVNAVAVDGNTVVIGGTFTSLQPPGGGATTTQSFLAAFDRVTGQLDSSFHPTLDQQVNSIDVVGNTVVVGGAFSTVNGVAMRGLAELNVSDGSLTAFRAPLNVGGAINAVVVRSGRLFVGGRFSSINGVARNGLAALNPTTGAVDTALNLPLGAPRTGSTVPFVRVLDVSPDGTSLFVGGNFGTIAGLPRAQVALVNTATNTLSAWSTSVFAVACAALDNTYIRAVNFSPDGKYFVIGTSGGPKAGTLCDTATRWETNPGSAGQSPTWVDSTGGDSLYSVAATGTAVYVGGHQRWMNNSSGSNSAGPGAYQLGSDPTTQGDLAALDPVSGTPLPWGATLSPRGVGAQAMLATSSGLWVGSDTSTTVGAEQRIAFFPVAGGSSVPAPTQHFLPSKVYISGPGNTLVSRTYNASAFGASSPVTSPGSVPWNQLKGAFMINGEIFYAIGDANLYEATFDGTTVGTPAIVTSNWFAFNSVKAMTFDSGRMYYVTGDGKLYYRLFNGVTPIVGSALQVAAASGYGSVTSMFITDGDLYFQEAGKLWRQAMNGAVPSGPSVEVSGPSVDAVTWAATSTFVPPAPAGIASGPVDLAARDAHGKLWLYPGTGTGGFAKSRLIGVGWNAFTAILGPGDFTGDGHADIIARDSANRLWLYPGNGLGGFLHAVQIGAGWSFTAIIAIHDFNGDGHADLAGRDTSGRLWLYPGNGASGFLAPRQIGTGWNSMTAMIGIGDFNGDGHADLASRDTAGKLWLYPGNGTGGFLPRVQIGTGWNSMTAIIGIGDFNGDGHADLASRDTAGKLWLYPGNGASGFLPRVQIGTGWNPFTAIIGTGDFTD